MENPLPYLRGRLNTGMRRYLVDQFGDMSLYDIPVMLLSMLAAGLLAGALGFALPKESRGMALKSGAFIAAMFAFAGVLSRGSLPIAVLIGSAIVLGGVLLRGADESFGVRLHRLLALLVGVACGVKAAAIAAIAAVPLFILLFLASKKG